MAAASFASRGAGKQQGKPRCQLVESLAEGMLLHGQHAPPCLLALWVLAGWFPAISQSSKAFIVWFFVFFFSQPSKLHQNDSPPEFSISLQLFTGWELKSREGGAELDASAAVRQPSGRFSSRCSCDGRREQSSSLFSSIQVTLISAFVFPQLPPKPVNVFFAFCISLCCISAGILVSTATFAVQAFESMTEDEV